MVKIIQEVRRPLPVLVQHERISSFHEQGANRPSGHDIFSRFNREMKRRKTFNILNINQSSLSYNILKSKVSTCKSSPMQRCWKPFISGVDIQTKTQKESNRYWLITLCTNMKHIDLLRICCKRISTFFNKVLNETDISKERSEVHSCETIITFWLSIYPLLQVLSVLRSIFFILAISILKYMFNQDLCGFHRILKSCEMQWRETFSIKDGSDVNKLSCTSCLPNSSLAVLVWYKLRKLLFKVSIVHFLNIVVN